MKVFGQSTKESYRDDIETSRKHKTVYKLYEWLDDYSYCSTSAMGIYLCRDDDENFLYLFQDDGPKDLNILRKFLEWRRSGSSNEIGHKGGGNKRNIYGHYCDEAVILMRMDDKIALRCGARPNDLYDLSISDIDEESFRSECDSSTYITNPVKDKIKNLPSWYEKTFNLIEEDSGITPNFLIRMNLTDIPNEYKQIIEWTELINQIRAKQYDIKIKFKNELLGMEDYKEINNIDLVGFNDDNKISDMNIKLYIDTDKKQFYVYRDNKYINVRERKEETNIDNLKEWGNIRMFIVSEPYIKNELKEYNSKDMKKFNKQLKQEDFYGVYLQLNNKLTNYLPFEGKLLGESKNNGINIEPKFKNSGRFRMILIPNNENCKDSNIFDNLIQTREIKSLTGFLENSPYKDIISSSMKLYKGENILKINKPKEKKIKIEKINDGGIYLMYLNNGLYKYGMVNNYDKIDERLSRHKNESLDTIKDFIDVLDNKKMPESINGLVIYKLKTPLAAGGEEKIMKILEDNKNEKIKLIQSNRSEHETREYFVCNDFDYIYNNIMNKIKIEFE